MRCRADSHSSQESKHQRMLGFLASLTPASTPSKPGVSVMSLRTAELRPWPGYREAACARSKTQTTGSWSESGSAHVIT